MAEREPDWFRPEPFCREVFNFSFRELGVRPLETAEALNHYRQEFKDAVQVVGKSVFTLQLIIRNKLRPLFIESINLIADIVHGNIHEKILQFMSQSYLHGDIYKTVLTCFAIVAELILFLDDLGIPIPAYWFPMPWVAIYEHQLRHPLAYHGGWEQLLKEARRRYIDTGFYTEASLSFANNNPIQHAEVSDRNNWPDNPAEFFLIRFGVAPQSTTLAMRILENIYSSRNIVPFPGAGADVMLEMLGLWVVDPGQDPVVDPGQDPVVDPGQDPVVDPGQDPVVDPGQDDWC